ncbi:hypothetical protein VTK56DRAFT_5395 [Thermocarpiscus australiensis]
MHLMHGLTLLRPESSFKEKSDSLNMPLKKAITPKSLERTSFPQARLDRISSSMQPLLTKTASDAEMKKIMEDAEKNVKGRSFLAR